MVIFLSRWLSRTRNNFFLIDIIIFLVTPLLALAIRLDSWTAFTSYLPNLWVVIFLFLVIKLMTLYLLGFYQCFWRYASIDELVAVAKFAGVTIVIEIVLLNIFNNTSLTTTRNIPYSLPLLDGLLSLIFIGGVRFSMRMVERMRQRSRVSISDRTLIVGAGSAGISLVQDMQRNSHWGCPVAFIDDDPKKRNLRIRGIPVVGHRYQIPEIVRSLKVHKIVIAIPTAPGNEIREISEICRKTQIPTSTLPGIHELLNSQLRVDCLREVQIEDLLRREPIQTDVQRVAKLLRGKRVLITGAGGSIGSELCRQILRFNPSELILLGKGENSIFHIHQELEHMVQTFEQVDEHHHHLSVCICDIRTLARLEYAFEQYQPEVIFHAAAHKHVPLMQSNASEAITANVLGTQNLLELSLQWKVEHFVMISTDKAVNPSSVMGASKRVAEMLVLQAAKTSGQPYVAVRFGNVLGSRGSVVPTFQQQIAAGGPVTVTHPDVCRYFMTIPEAVQLVLQAAVLGQGGEVFMLDMGQPVKIVNLAEDLIRLSGHEVGKDIEITYTGLRPGEKLIEELFITGEQYARTKHEKVLMVRNASSTIPRRLASGVEILCTAAANNDTKLIHFMLERLVEGYVPDSAKTLVQSR
jgi:FlaA1/EpsC-like NDP-sugar epimerase